MIPHEIGVALGYPLDDVFGYMGLLPLACKGVCGWKVYGCMAESRRRSCAFNDARCQALIFFWCEPVPRLARRARSFWHKKTPFPDDSEKGVLDKYFPLRITL